MSQLMRCRCGRWTTYGLACTSCKSVIPSNYDDEIFEITESEEENEEAEKEEEG